MRKAAVQFVLQQWTPILIMGPERIQELGVSIPLPIFSEDVICEVCEEAEKVFQRSETVINLTGSFYVVGDIHGNIFDLVRILQSARMPPASKFIFLGDYVDRGQYSVDVITLLFALKVVYPEMIHMIRGNHEVDSLNYTYGFYNEVNVRYKNDSVYNSANNAFSYLPLAAIINNSVFAVHGGIAPDLTNADQLNKLKRPIMNNDMVVDLLWSDPSNTTTSIEKNERGMGIKFGVEPLKEFLDHFNCKYMIRAHQCMQNGISVFGGGLLYTVFSCSNYCELNGNRCGLMLILENSSEFQVFSLPQINQIPMCDALLDDTTDKYLGLITTEQNSLALHIKIGKKAKSRSLHTLFDYNQKNTTPHKVSHENFEYNMIKTGLRSPAKRHSQLCIPTPKKKAE